MIYDIAIIGAGIAGASLAAELDERMSVVLIEAEDRPGYHATGRSAAFWDECYGGPEIQPLTSASGGFLSCPPSDFSDQGFLSPRGSLYLGQREDEPELRAFYEKFSSQGVKLALLDPLEVRSRVPGLRDRWTLAVHAPDCSDIDVATLHQAYLRQAKHKGVDLATNARVSRLDFGGGFWQIKVPNCNLKARRIVNAAGAWADEVAEMARISPLGHQPFRRTVAQICVAPAAPPSLPLVIDFKGNFYFKPDTGGRLWLSPHDETPSAPCDAAVEEIDLAVAIDNFEKAVDWTVKTVERCWAGLRTFAPDRLPVFGFDKDVPSFFWCTGQGGFGIQTAPAAAKLCAALVEGRTLNSNFSDIDPRKFAPDRFTV
jgi:D-arginine dehydrogenase